MMNKLTTQAINKMKSSSLKYIKEKREDIQNITMTKVTTGPETDLTVVIGECHLVVEVGMYRIMDRIIEEDCSMLTGIEMTLGEEIFEKCKIIKISIISVDIETIIVN